MADEKKTEEKTAEKKPRVIRKGTKVALDAILAKFDGLAKTEKGGYVHFGNRPGPRVAVSKAGRVGRVLIYKLAVDDPAILQYSKEQQKALKVGRACGEVDFSKAEAEILAACEKLAAAIKAAPVKKAREPKAPKA